MDWDGELHQDDLHSHFSEGIDSIARLVGFSVGILLLRRIPAVLVVAKWVPEIRTLREALFVGWFGPMGIGAIYYALKACKFECVPSLWDQE
jgi:NhaP-type Na+/H+ or K+/H+ antiporter